VNTRRLLIIVVSVAVVILAAVVVMTRDDGRPATGASSPAVPLDPTPGDAAPGSPSAAASGGPVPSSGPTVSASPATTFASTGALVSGRYWLRDAAHEAAGFWTFAVVPASGDFVLDVEVLATDAVGGARDQDARFFIAWAATVPSGPNGWTGRLPVTLPNVSRDEDPVGYTCRGTVTIPRSTLQGAVTLAVRISRDDVRGELDPSDVHVAVDAASVRLRFP